MEREREREREREISKPLTLKNRTPDKDFGISEKTMLPKNLFHNVTFQYLILSDPQSHGAEIGGKTHGKKPATAKI